MKKKKIDLAHSFGDISKKMTLEREGYLLWDGKLYRLGKSQ